MGFGEVSFPEQFNWISFIDNLAGGDFTKYDYVSEKSYEECLYCLLYRHNVDKYKDQINRKQELRNRK